MGKHPVYVVTFWSKIALKSRFILNNDAGVCWCTLCNSRETAHSIGCFIKLWSSNSYISLGFNVVMCDVSFNKINCT